MKRDLGTRRLVIRREALRALTNVELALVEGAGETTSTTGTGTGESCVKQNVIAPTSPHG